MTTSLRPSPGMTIGGESVLATAGYEVIDPATEQPLADAPECSPQQLDRAFASAASAFPAWSADEDHRRDLLSKLAESIVAAGEELTDLLIAETGKPRDLAAIEIVASKMWLEYASQVELERHQLLDDATATVTVRHRPLGVVAAIIPWNFPVVMAVTKIAAALRTGNTVVLKPSPFSPFSSLRVGEIMNELLPPGVVNMVSGGDELGAAMTAHPTPRKITFTGSIAAGKRVAESAGRDLKRVTLELGGNDAAILLDDVDIAATAPALLARAFFNTGQACALPKRIYAPSNIYDDVVDALADAARAIVPGAAAGSAAMGPLSTRPQYERVRTLVDDAVAQGLRTVTGGRAIDGPGFFFEPTILADAHHGVRIVDEEQFGPALPIMRYDALDDAVAQANDTMFGLCGSVWGSDLDHATAVAERLECGVTYVNSHGVHRPDMQLLGVKWSGVGTEHGLEGMLEYTDTQVVYRARQVIDTALTD